MFFSSDMEPYWGNIGNIKDSQALIFTYEPGARPVGARDFVVPSRMNPGPLGFALRCSRKDSFEHRRL